MCWSCLRTIDQRGGYTIRINDKEWLRSSQTSLYLDNKWYSSDDQSLPLINITAGKGTDRYLGSWNETQLNYHLIQYNSITSYFKGVWMSPYVSKWQIMAYQ
jgi:hypothetical protein